MAAKLVLLLLAAVCSVQSFYFLDHEFDETPLGKAIDKASMRVLKEAFDAASDKNVVSSPLGALILLSQYLAGTSEGGKLQNELISVLGAEDYSKSLGDYSSLNKQLLAMDSSFFTLKNKIYVAEQFQLNDRFSSVSKNDFQSEVERMSFTDATAAAKIINDWAEKETRGHIRDGVSPDALTPDIAVALFNVIFFQGHWSVPFNASETHDLDFHVDKETTVKKPTMHIMQSLFYHESPALGARMVELPYKEKGFRMVIVLPDEIDGLHSVLEKVSRNGLLDEIFKLEPAGSDVSFNMPKFEVESELNLKGILEKVLTKFGKAESGTQAVKGSIVWQIEEYSMEFQKVGVPSLFSEEAPNVVKEDSVKVTKAFQKAFIKVDEEGATAAAITGVFAGPKSFPLELPQPIVFNADHPFIYSILFEDKVIFTGTYTH